MSSEKKLVLVALVISAAIVVALCCALWFYGAVMSGTVIGAFVIVYFIVSAVVYNMAEEFRYLRQEKRILADYEATHLRKMPDVPITRKARIVEHQHRN